VGKPLLAVIAGCCLAGSFAARASAEDFPRLAESLRYEVSGRVSPHCQLNQTEHSINFGDILDTLTGGSLSATAQVGVRIDCNAPFAISFHSDQGGMRLDGEAAPSPFRAFIPYVVSVDLEQAALSGRASCRSERMTDARSCVLGASDAGSEAQARISLAVAADERPLMSGHFSDQLWMRVTPLLGGETVAHSSE